MPYDQFGQWYDEDPFQVPDDQEYLEQLYAQQPFQVPGKTPGNQQTYLKNKFDLMGFNPISLAGNQQQGMERQEAFTEQLNPEREIYGGSPLYASIFQAIDGGADPITATKAAIDQLGKYTDTEQRMAAEAQALGIAQNYAMNNIEAENARMQFDTDNYNAATSFTKADGSKYKNAPLGGVDITGTASEFDLLGRPDQTTLVNDYVQQNMRSATGRNAPGGKPKPAGMLAATSDVYESQGDSGHGDATVRTQVGRDAQYAGAGQTQGRKGRGAGRQRQASQPIADQAADDEVFERYMRMAANKGVNARLQRSRQTRVRSDANNNAMRIAAKYAQYMQRPFDE